MCRLKSPVMRSSEEEDMKSSRREVNSEMKIGLEEDESR